MIKIFILLIFWLAVVPFVVGLYAVSFEKKESKNICLALVLGFLIEFLVFQVIAIPIIFLRFSYTFLKYAWMILMLIIFGISIYKNKNIVKNIFPILKEKAKELPLLITIVFSIIVIFQGYVSFMYMHEDYDDSNFVAKATIARDTNTLFVYNDIGMKYDSFPVRHVFSPFPFFTAVMADLIGTHPAVMAHSIFPVIFLIVTYAVLYLIGKTLFKGDKKKVMIYMLILGILYTFGNYTRYSPFVRILSRAWQGKSLLVNIILPFIIYLYLEFLIDKDNKFSWILLFITLWAADLLSSMSLFLPLIEAGTITLIYTIKNRKIKYLINLVLCSLPSITYGIIYFIIK